MLLFSLLVGAVMGLFDRRVLLSIVIMGGLLLVAAVGMSSDGDLLGGLGWFFANLAVFEAALVGVGFLASFREMNGETKVPSGAGLPRGRGNSIASVNCLSFHPDA